MSRCARVRKRAGKRSARAVRPKLCRVAWLHPGSHKRAAVMGAELFEQIRQGRFVAIRLDYTALQIVDQRRLRNAPQVCKGVGDSA